MMAAQVESERRPRRKEPILSWAGLCERPTAVQTELRVTCRLDRCLLDPRVSSQPAIAPRARCIVLSFAPSSYRRFRNTPCSSRPLMTWSRYGLS